MRKGVRSTGVRSKQEGSEPYSLHPTPSSLPPGFRSVADDLRRSYDGRGSCDSLSEESWRCFWGASEFHGLHRDEDWRDRYSYAIEAAEALDLVIPLYDCERHGHGELACDHMGLETDGQGFPHPQVTGGRIPTRHCDGCHRLVMKTWRKDIGLPAAHWRTVLVGKETVAVSPLCYTCANRETRQAEERKRA